MSLNLEAADILLAARDEVMKPGGWCQINYGAFSEPEGPVCAYGALARVSGLNPCYLDNAWGVVKLPTDEPAVLAVVATLSVSSMNLSSFNDQRDTTASDVADLFDRAAAELKGRS